MKGGAPRADVLALLERGPMSTTGLAALFAVDLSVMTRRLGELATQGVIRRESTSGRWARVVVRALGTIADLEAVYEQVRFAPKAAPQIAAALSAAPATVVRALEQLRAVGRVRVVGRNSGARWAAAGWRPSDSARAARSRQVPPKASVPRINENAHGHLFPPKVATKVAPDGTSWWVAAASPEAPRAEFYAAARVRDAAGRTDPMWRRASKVIEISSGRTDV